MAEPVEKTNSLSERVSFTVPKPVADLMDIALTPPGSLFRSRGNRSGFITEAIQSRLELIYGADIMDLMTYARDPANIGKEFPQIKLELEDRKSFRENLKKALEEEDEL